MNTTRIWGLDRVVAVTVKALRTQSAAVLVVTFATAFTCPPGAQAREQAQEQGLAQQTPSAPTAGRPDYAALLNGPEFAPTRQRAKQLTFQRQRLDDLLWAPEVLAQKYESRFVSLWDDLLRKEDKWAVLADFPFAKLQLGKHISSDLLELDIGQYRFGAGGESLTPDQWQGLLKGFEWQGYSVAQTEWHHARFEPPGPGRTAKSQVNVTLHVARQQPAHRLIVRGVLDVDWAPEDAAAGEPVPETIRVAELEILERRRPPAFQEVFRVSGSEAQPLVHPILVYDLDRDGLSEIVVGGQNLVIWNHGGGEFTTEPLLQPQRSLYDGAVLADFTGDGHVDLVAVDQEGFPLLFKANDKGRFSEPPVRIADTHLGFPKTFTAGDIDGDGDQDLFIANYKFAYRQGQMPTPYYDANDGYPAYLLRNDGDAKFSDVTEISGLAGKRFRRSFSSSLVDLDDDRDLDLIVVSDYAGFDAYLNDGQGRFTDVSERFGLDRHLFGMGHTFADYDNDGSLDFYVIGMSSTTARRLERLGLNRDDKPQHNTLRAAMGYGNRMFLRRDGGFVRAPFNDQVARTGWSWGASSFDFDNDGDKDIFVANGHYSGRSTQDYCTTFWRHDIYEEGSEDDLARDLAFQVESSSLRKADISWNGYEHKVLMMNRGGEEFVNIAFLMGAGFEYDGRAVVAEDLDADGRVDLLVSEFRTTGLDNNTYVLHVYRNALAQAGHWVGVRLGDHAGGYSPIGATVTVKSGEKTQMTRVVTGDSFSAQHSATVHFGLGASDRVDAIEVRWPNGTFSRLDKPAGDRYHTVTPAARALGEQAADAGENSGQRVY